MGYLHDTNIFIKSKNELPADVWPTFWLRMSELIKAGLIFSSIKVKEEIARGKDELVSWLEANAPSEFYFQIDELVLTKYSRTVAWAMGNPVYTDAARHEYAHVADAYIVATAASRNLTIVTNELPDASCKRRVKIPDACEAMGVRYCDLNTVFRELRVTI